MTAAVTVYTTPTCPWCDRAKDYLRANNIDYVEKDVATDRTAAIEMVRRTGQQGVPVIATQDEVILGFDQQRLARLVQKHAGPKRPPLGLRAADAEQYLQRHPDVARNYPDGTKGVFVGDIRPGGVAEASGLRHGDVIQAVAGKRVRGLAAMDQMIDTLKAGESVTVRFVRDGADHNTEFQF